MKLDEAFKHVDGVVQKYLGTRADHALLQQAMLTIKQSLEDGDKANTRIAELEAALEEKHTH